MEKSLQEALTERIGQSVTIYGRTDYTIVSVHSREARIVAPKTRKNPASVKFPKHRTLAAAFDAADKPVEAVA